MSEPTSLPPTADAAARVPVPAPALPSTADVTPYVPVSWVAVTAATVSVVFFFILSAFGYVAFANKKPLIEVGLLAIPTVALVLCFAARRIIRNSEGTRTELLYGVNLVNTAWWLALVLGLCYGAYLLAIDYAIRREAEGEQKKWMDALRALPSGRDPSEKDENLARAFYHTIPAKSRNVVPNDVDKMRAQFGDGFLAFSNSDLVRLAQRNGDELKFAPGTVSWELKSGGLVECQMSGVVECREGTFPIALRLGGEEVGTGKAAAGRQWSIARPQESGFIDQARVTRTPYGWLLWLLEKDGGGFGKDFVTHMRLPFGNRYAYRGYIAPGGDRVGWGEVAGDPSGLLAFAFAMPSAALGDAGYEEFVNNKLYRLRTGEEPPPEKKALFLRAWNEGGIRQAGERLKGTPDKDEALTVTETAIEVRLPLEIGLFEKPGEKVETARGRLVVACTDPALLELVKQYKESADPTRGTFDLPPELRAELFERYGDRKKSQLVIPWRVARIESNLDPAIVAQQRQGGPGGAPGGPGGGPPGPGGR